MCIQNFYRAALALLLLRTAASRPEVKDNNDTYTFDLVFPDFEHAALGVPSGRSAPALPNDKIYSVVTFSKANWFVAQQTCGFHGLSLASVNSEAEKKRLDDFIKSNGFNSQSVWLSGTPVARQGKWFWFNIGRPLTYTNWRIGEPNNAGGQEECLQRIPDGQWNDLSCYSSLQFICETRCPLDSYDVPIYNKRR